MHQQKALYECVQNCFFLKKIAVPGGPCETIDGNKRNAHILVAFYVAGILEAKNPFIIKRGNQTYAPCHIVFVEKHKLAEFSSARAMSMIGLE